MMASSNSKSFELYGDEDLIDCPYNKSHQIINKRFINHLTKCRRNYEMSMEKHGQMLQTLSCKYCEAQVFSPEILYHETNCSYKDPKVKAEMEHMKDDMQQKLLIMEPDSDKSSTTTLSTSTSQSGPRQDFSGVGVGVMDFTRRPGRRPGAGSFVSGWSDMTLSSASTATTTLPASVSSTSGGKSVNPLEKYPEHLRHIFEVDEEDDWDTDCKARNYVGFDPMRNEEQRLFLKYPPGLTKAERKTWKDANQVKARRILGLSGEESAPE